MLKKSDILPLILATISTALIMSLGFLVMKKFNLAGLGQKTQTGDNSVLDSLNVETNPGSSSLPNDSSKIFVMPAIVPQGTAVIINGSSKANRINYALGRGFHRQFPGTAIITNADGNKSGIELLISGAIDLATLDRPLNEAEKASGLAALKIINSIEVNNNSQTLELYYAYRQPPTSEVKAFLGYVLSPQGQQAINQL